jgi:hypothetical protein
MVSTYSGGGGGGGVDGGGPKVWPLGVVGVVGMVPRALGGTSGI